MNRCAIMRRSIFTWNRESRAAVWSFATGLQRRCAGPELAAADPHPSDGEGASGRAGRDADHRYEDHADGGPVPSEAYGRGDFRQATYRAVRQGLMQAESVLLEPWYTFRLELPAEQVGRAMADIQKMYGSFEAPQMEGENAVLTGSAPASEMVDYPAEVQSYTGGRGRLSLRLSGYQPCHNEEEVLADIGYDCDADVDNPSGSIFCSHGAGYFVPWDEVPEKMHIKEEDRTGREKAATDGGPSPRQGSVSPGLSYEEDKELEAIFLREFGSRKQQEDRYSGYRKSTAGGVRTAAPARSTFAASDRPKR